MMMTYILDTVRAPQCADDCTIIEGCEVCRMYSCNECGSRVPWDNGGTDGPECDDCWLRAEERYAGWMQ